MKSSTSNDKAPVTPAQVSPMLRAKRAIDSALVASFNGILYLLARPMLRVAIGTWPRRNDLTAFRTAFRTGHHHLPRLFHGLAHVPGARFYLIDTMLAACRDVPPTPAEAAAHAPLAGKPVAFMHIEKTAGSSVMSFLERRYALTQIMPLAETAAASTEALRDPASQSFALVHGHYDFPTLETVAPGRLIVTFLREPAARILSAYRYWRSRQLSSAIDDINLAAVMAARLDLPDFLRSNLPEIRNQIDNAYVRRLTGLSATETEDPLQTNPVAALDQALAALDRFAFVGITERMDESLAGLAARLGLLPPARTFRINTSDENPATFPADFVPVARMETTPDITAELHRLTRLDGVLYRAALRRLG